MANLRLTAGEMKASQADRKQLEELRAKVKRTEDELSSKDAEIFELRAQIGRRDEQVEFLMQVHDATQDCEWVQPWTCPQCTLSNANERTQCDACGARRPG
eukprot:5987662-Prymnesium_polylepis.1